MCSAVSVYDQCATDGARALEDNLVLAATQGDAGAFETLAVRHRRIVLAITRRMTGSPVDAEDLTQQAFLKAFASISRFGGRCSFSTWLISIAINEARMWRRKARRSREITMAELCNAEDPGVQLDFMDSRPSPEATYSQEERLRLLAVELNRLNPATFEALRLCDLEENSAGDAASVLGITANGVKSRRLRGRAILRRRLEARLTKAKQPARETERRGRRSGSRRPQPVTVC